jgi:hypothetical protein
MTIDDRTNNDQPENPGDGGDITAADEALMCRLIALLPTPDLLGAIQKAIPDDRERANALYCAILEKRSPTEARAWRQTLSVGWNVEDGVH